jgi:predicted phosphate transport protein (TIGR00153 family)
MAINNILSIFLPKDKIFYNLFEQTAENVTLMGKLLKEYVYESDPAKRLQLSKDIEDLEHKNDEVTHNIFTELGKNFITPFDREDIHYLATAMDDVADYIYASCKKIQFHGVDPNDQGIQNLADIIMQGAIEVGKAVMQLRELKRPEKIMESLVKINSLENHADNVFDMSIKNLFDNENDFKNLIRRREVYTVMEVATDKCEDVANVIETIIVKYA